jgi:hypothetical protein
MAELVSRVNTAPGDGSGRASKAVEEFLNLAFDHRVAPLMGFRSDGTKED